MSVAARSKEPNSPVAFHTGKDGPRGTPRGGGPRGGAPPGAPGGGPVLEKRHETTATIFHETLSQYRAAEVLVEAGRGPCRLALAEAVLACVEINQCARSPVDATIQHEDTGIFFLHWSLRWRAPRRRSARRRTPRGRPAGWRAARRSAHGVLRRLQPPSTSRLAPGGCPLRRSGWARPAVH